MSILFKDKVYNDMNWLEAACRPIVDPLNEVLTSFPEKTEIKKEMIISGRQVDYTSVGDILRSSEAYCSLHYGDRAVIEKCFQFETNGISHYDSETDTVSGTAIYLVKIKDFFEEKETEKRIGAGTIDTIRCMSYRKINVSYTNEMLELFSLDEARRNRGKKVKLKAIHDKIEEIMSLNQWNIRDIALSNKFGIWMEAYMYTGNLAALANICKLKAMVHLEEPIYSMEEEEL